MNNTNGLQRVYRTGVKLHLRIFVAAAIFSVMASLLAVRVFGRLTIEQNGQRISGSMLDFRDAVYYPSVAWREGRNPYDYDEYIAQYPAGQPFFLYSPISLALFVPITAIDIGAAAVVYWAANLLMYLFLIFLVLRLVEIRDLSYKTLLFSSLFMATYPFYRNSISGQITIPLVIGTVVAVSFADQRPWLSGLGLAVASLKPTFGVPLALMMLCRGDFMPVLIGSAVAIIGVLLASIPLVSDAGGVNSLLDVFLSNIRLAESLHEPVTTWSRLDAPSAFSRLFGWRLSGPIVNLLSASILVISGLILYYFRRFSDGGHIGSVSSGLIIVTLLTSVYHNTYDLVLLIPLLIAVCENDLSKWGYDSRTMKLLVIGLMVIPLFNWMPCHTFLNAFRVEETAFVLVMSLNGICVFFLWLIISVSVATQGNRKILFGRW